jgi:ATP-dependent Clp protease ATP-binding subunit ClpC
MRAQKEAHALGAEEIAPEHLLIGLTAVERGTAARALAAQSVELERLRTEVGGEAVREPSRGRLPFSKEAKGVLESSVGEAHALGHPWVGSEHILLALLSAGGRPVEVLQRLGAEPDAVRDAIDQILSEAA